MSKKTKPTIAVVFGGTGPEHEISCMSAGAIIDHIPLERFNIRKIGINKVGKWIETGSSSEEIANGNWIKRSNNREVYLSLDKTFGGMRTIHGKEIKIDCCFPVIHGEGGEDGSIQGLLEIGGIPYVGSGILASASALDKGISKIIAERAGIKTTPYTITDRYKFSSQPREELARIEMELEFKYPLFVKPSTTGSSIGISKVTSQMELFEGIKLAATYAHKIVIEEGLVGRELEVAVLGNRDPQASPVGEILSEEEFYTYKAKYQSEKSKTEVVGDLPEVILNTIRHDGVKIYKAMGCRGLARVDFFLTDNGSIYFNEINTMPGFTKISLYPKLWEAAGVEFGELLARLIDLALEEQ